MQFQQFHKMPVLWGTIVLTAATTGLAGCGGGASATPTVRYLPSRPESATAETGAADTPATPEAEAEASGTGSLKGRVVYQGDFQPLPPLYGKGAAPKDTDVCGAEAIPDESVIVNNGGLANVFIFLPKAPKGAVSPTPAEPVIFDQKYCVFKPHALIVRAGQTIKILNSDGALHNTHTYPTRNPTFNQGVKPNDQVGVDLVYGRPESQPFMVGCDVHPWMKAYHLPLDHPFAAVSAADGTFEIKDLPAGKHSFKVWHEKGGELQKALTVTIKPGETTDIEIPVAAAQLSRREGPALPLVQLTFAQ
jgi:plastocyanin